MNRLIFCLGLSLLIISCEKGKNDENQDNIVFGGITCTTYEGIIISKDTNDWKLNEFWNVNEVSLFVNQMENHCNNNDLEYSIIAYPNPCGGIFYLDISKPEESLFAFRIIDKEFNVLMSKDSIRTSIAISLNDFGLMNDTVRIYYKFLGHECELNGHGDIKIVK